MATKKKSKKSKAESEDLNSALLEVAKHVAPPKDDARKVLSRLLAGMLVCLMLCTVGCAAHVEDSAPAPEAPTAQSLPDRLCASTEKGMVGAPGLDLTGYECTEVVNNSGIPGGRAWCCPRAFDEGSGGK